MVDTYISTRVVHSCHPRVPVLKVWHFDVRKARPKTRALAQCASARQTRARHHRPRTLSFRSRCPVGTYVVNALGAVTVVTRHRIMVLIDIANLIRRICYDNNITYNVIVSTKIQTLFDIIFKLRTLFEAERNMVVSYMHGRGKPGGPGILLDILIVI